MTPKPHCYASAIGQTLIWRESARAKSYLVEAVLNFDLGSRNDRTEAVKWLVETADKFYDEFGGVFS
jgi:hypothetical protein